MKKSLTALALTAALTGGGVATATVFAAPAQAAPPVTQSTEENADNEDSDKTGLLGLLGLLGLAGLAKKKEHVNHTGTTTR